MNIFYNDRDSVELAGYKATPINYVKKGMRKIEETSNAEIYKKGRKYFAKFKSNS